jgi:hypothetical protein
MQIQRVRKAAENRQIQSNNLLTEIFIEENGLQELKQSL